MKRIVNFRTFLITAVFVICSTLSGYLFYLNNYAIIPFVLLMVLALVLCVVYRKEYHKLITFILAIIFSLTSFITLSVGLYSYKDERVPDAQFISGRIVSMTDNGKKSVVVDNLKMGDTLINGKMIINFSDDDSDCVEYLRYGDVVSLKSNSVKFNEILRDGEFLSYYYIDDYRYTVYTSLNAITVTLGDMNFFESVHYRIREVLVDSIGDHGNIAYGVLTGNKNFIDSEIREEYSVSGLAHILAVSGLHIGFLVSLLSFILRLCKVKKLPSLIIIATILVLYNVFIGGAVSAVRATIMALVLLSARCVGARSDSLNNLSLAVTLILSFIPQSIFDAGFLMSVGAVFGVVAIYPSIYKLVSSKIQSKLIKGMLSVVFISFSAQIGITPASIITFNTISPFSVLANIVVVPIMGIAYAYLLISTLLSLLIPIGAVILYPIKLFFMLIGIINNFIYEIPYSQIVVYGTTIVFIIYLLLFIASRFVMISKRIFPILVAVVLSFSILIVENIPQSQQNSIIYSGSKWDVTSIVCTQDETIIVGDMYSKVTIENIQKLRVRKIDKVFLTRLNAYNVGLVINVCKIYGVDTVYLNIAEVDNLVILDLLDTGVKVLDVKTQDYISSIYNEGVFCGYALTVNGYNVLHLKGNVSPQDLPYNHLSTFEYLRCSEPFEYDWGEVLDNYKSETNQYEQKRVVVMG